MKKHNTRTIRAAKFSDPKKSLQMLTCYDFQTAQLLNELPVDLILVGDSVGNVVLGYDTTVEVSLSEMITFGSAVKRGAKSKFVVVDLPFGTYSTFNEGVKSATTLFKETKAEAIKLEGAHFHQLEIMKRLTETGVPVMGHIGLTPQFVHEMGGYYTHGKNEAAADCLLKEAMAIEEAGAFSIVLECVDETVAAQISKQLSIPTIGIGSGQTVDGQVLVINDLLHFGKKSPPKFCTPMINLYEIRKEVLNNYLLQADQSHDKNLHP